MEPELKRERCFNNCNEMQFVALLFTELAHVLIV